MSDFATDAQTPADAEPDLEEQVEGLLSEVMDTVEEINRKLEEDNPEESIDSDTVVDDAGATAVRDPDDPPVPVSEAGEAGEAEGVEDAGAEEDPEPSPSAVVAEEDEEEPGDEQPTDEQPTDDEESGVDVESLLSDLEEVVSRREAEREKAKSEDDTAAAEDSQDEQAGATVPDYGDIDSLDDELAALASEALDEDIEDNLETSIPPIDISTESAAPEPAAPEEEAGSSTPQAADPTGPTGPTGPAGPDTFDSVPSEPQAGSAAASPGPGPGPGPSPSPTQAPANPRWGWLPPRPEWEQVYSRWRPLIIAWRYTVWIVPPMLVFAGRGLIKKLGKIEPVALNVAAAVAAPLSGRDERTRSIIGWFAIYTLFCAACLWSYNLFARSPAVPPTNKAPITLEGEQSFASSDAKP